MTLRQALSISSVTISVPNPRRAARFYQQLLGWEIAVDEEPRVDEPREAGWAQLRAPEGTPGLTTVNLEWERHHVRPVWPSRPGEQQVTTHLDIPVDDLEAAVAQAQAAGAHLAAEQPQQDVQVMLDPDGHPFCFFLD